MYKTASLAWLLLLAGCGPSSHTVVSVGNGGFSIDGDKVVLHGPADSSAEITGDGSLSVDRKPVTVSDAQRASLVRYHATAMQFIEHAKDTGKAGAQIGVAAVEEVAKGLSSGDTSKIGERIEAKVGPVKAAAAKLCEDLAVLADLQAKLAAELAAFRPFAATSAGDSTKCHQDLEKAPGSSAG